MSAAAPREPDLTILARYVRNRLRAGETANFIAEQTEIVIARIPGNRLMIATHKGGSIILTGPERVNPLTFKAAGFSLRLSRFLARLFAAIRGIIETL